MNIKLALVIAPPTPACFPDRMQWAAYLLQCHEYAKRPSASPFDAKGVYRPAWSFCADCTGAHALQMRNAGKCKPDAFRVIPIKEAACSN